jgi:hypothetical protein
VTLGDGRQATKVEELQGYVKVGSPSSILLGKQPHFQEDLDGPSTV